MKIFVTGGAGYCGSVLIPMLLSQGHEVTIYDIGYFGFKHIARNESLTIIKGDIRDIDKLKASLAGHEIVIHLACISNDASFVLDENLSTTINYNAFEPLVKASKGAGIRRFVYASSSSVYGVSDEPDVFEDHPLLPLTLYNKFKGMCEPILNDYADNDFEVVTFRPATVCGFSPRLRLDLSVNILTNLAITNKKITVFGGRQLRPNLDIRDYSRAVICLIGAETKYIQKEVFNVGYQNMSINDLALLVKKTVGKTIPGIGEIAIETSTTDDNRSYHINSEKITRVIGFEPIYTIENAIISLCNAFIGGKVPNSLDDPWYYNIRTMQKLGAK